MHKLAYLACSLALLSSLMGCQQGPSGNNNGAAYFSKIKDAEQLICQEQFSEAVHTYQLAFNEIEKPFGKDVFNAALASAIIGQTAQRDTFLQFIINNTIDLTFVQSVFLEQYLNIEAWNVLIHQRQLEIDEQMLGASKAMFDREQLYRPQYGTHDAEIEANRKLNLAQVLEITDESGFPCHFTMGYRRGMLGQDFHVVLHHTAQRRGKDKSIFDLKPLLKEAVEQGRFDPETAIFYLSFQNEANGRYDMLSTWQYKNPLLPDSLNQLVWISKFSEAEKAEIDSTRAEWHANSINEVLMKAAFLAKSDYPFIFSGVKTAVRTLRDDLGAEQVLERYQVATGRMEAYQIQK